HEKMNEGTYEFDGKIYVGFDFLFDWENNHEDKIRVLKRSTRIVQRYLDLDVDKILTTIVDFMNDNGYKMTPNETLCIRHTIIKTQRLIFQ
ncbi:MAG: hypothetical protein R3321_12385, partial [Nitrososphaeraceae archaeon]|nr:hypothetical protein [Nitrososphaeraceae archaeon]